MRPSTYVSSSLCCSAAVSLGKSQRSVPGSSARFCPRAGKSLTASRAAAAKNRRPKVAFKSLTLRFARCREARRAVFAEIHSARHLLAFEGSLVGIAQGGAFDSAAARKLDLVAVDVTLDGTLQQPRRVLPGERVPFRIQIEAVPGGTGSELELSFPQTRHIAGGRGMRGFLAGTGGLAQDFTQAFRHQLVFARPHRRGPQQHLRGFIVFAETGMR